MRDYKTLTVEEKVLLLKDNIYEVESGVECVVFNDELYEAIVNELKGLIYNHTRMSHVRKFEFDDLYQEALLALIKAVQRFNPEVSPYFSPYYSLILKSRYFAMVKRFTAQKRGSGQIDLPFDLPENIAEDSLAYAPSTYVSSSEPTPEEVTIVRTAFNQFILKLRPTEQRYFVKYLQQFSDPEIAEELNISYGNMSNIKRRAKNRLRNHVGYED